MNLSLHYVFPVLGILNIYEETQSVSSYFYIRKNRQK